MANYKRSTPRKTYKRTGSKNKVLSKFLKAAYNRKANAVGTLMRRASKSSEVKRLSKKDRYFLFSEMGSILKQKSAFSKGWWAAKGQNPRFKRTKGYKANKGYSKRY
jgi:hypothetical protein